MSRTHQNHRGREAAHGHVDDPILQENTLISCQASSQNFPALNRLPADSHPSRRLPEQRPVVQAAGAVRRGGEVLHGSTDPSQQRRLLDTPSSSMLASAVTVKGDAGAFRQQVHASLYLRDGKMTFYTCVQPSGRIKSVHVSLNLTFLNQTCDRLPNTSRAFPYRNSRRDRHLLCLHRLRTHISDLHLNKCGKLLERTRAALTRSGPF